MYINYNFLFYKFKNVIGCVKQYLPTKLKISKKFVCCILNAYKKKSQKLCDYGKCEYKMRF